MAQPWTPEKMRRVLLALAVVVTIVALGAWLLSGGRESTDNAQIDGHLTPIAPRVGGTVLEVTVTDNQAVDAGAVLVRIDSRDYEVALARAQADLADAQAALQAAQTGIPIATTTTAGQLTGAQAGVERATSGQHIAGKDVEVARARLTAAQARQREAQANDVRASRDLDRMKQLIAKDEVSQQQYDTAVAAAAAARAAVDSTVALVLEAEQAVASAESRQAQAGELARQARADLKTAELAPAQVSLSRARAASAEARVAQATAILEQARFNLAYTTIAAPTAGIVSRKSVEPGQVVAPGQSLMAVVPLDRVWVTANFKETQLTDFKPGMKARIHVDTYGREYTGTIDSIAAATGARFSLLPPENATGNFVKIVQRIPVKITLDAGQDKDHLLRPGMSVTATVFTR
jgi:membrane fusion protein, multidrug efflux system